MKVELCLGLGLNFSPANGLCFCGYSAWLLKIYIG